MSTKLQCENCKSKNFSVELDFLNNCKVTCANCKKELTIPNHSIVFNKGDEIAAVNNNNAGNSGVVPLDFTSFDQRLSTLEKSFLKLLNDKS